MSSYRETVAKHFKDLIADGRALLGGRRGVTVMLVDPDKFFRFRTQDLNIVRRACGEDSDHYRQLSALAAKTTQSHYLPNILGILEAAEHDFNSGLLFDMKTLMRAELLSDFMEQAEHLLDTGYHSSAASLAGAILEDTLRKLSQKRQIPLESKTGIERLNVELAKVQAYDRMAQKQITAFADIRNNADHGHFDKIRPEDVRAMLTWVRRFAAEHLSS